MKQIKSFTLTGSNATPIGGVIEKAVNPFMAENEGSEIESINIEQGGSFHKATVIVSYVVSAKVPVVESPAYDEPVTEKRKYTKK